MGEVYSGMSIAGISTAAYIAVTIYARQILKLTFPANSHLYRPRKSPLQMSTSSMYAVFSIILPSVCYLPEFRIRSISSASSTVMDLLDEKKFTRLLTEPSKKLFRTVFM